jgi:hypothetical protein
MPRLGAQARAHAPRAALVALVALFSSPLNFFAAAPDLDGSWQTGLALAAHQGLDFGRDVVFTYGPLGYLLQVELIHRDQAMLGLFFGLAVHVAAVALLLRVSLRSLGPVLGVLAAFAAARLLATGAPYRAEPVFLLWALEALRPQSARAWGASLAWLGPPAAIVFLYIKVNIGAAALAAVIVGVAALGLERRRLAIFAGWSLFCLLALWLVAGQPLGALPDYLWHSKEIASGYAGALGLPVPAQWRWTPAVALIVLAIVGMLAWRLTALWPDGRRRGALLCVAIVSFFVWKEGFVRANPDVFFECALALVLAVGAPRARLQTAAIALVPLVGFFAVTQNSLTYFSPRAGFDHLRDGARMTLSAARFHRQVRAKRAELRALYGFDAPTLAALSGHTVDVDPQENTVFFAYPELRWRPLPVLQAYAAYTPALDDLDATRLSAAAAPERILRQTRGSVAGVPVAVDGRNAAWDPPRAKVALLCHYAGERAAGAWQVLRRVPDRCGAQRRLSEVSAPAGTAVAIPPAPAPDTAVLVRIGGAEPGLLARLTETLYRIGPVTVQLDQGRARLVAATAASSHILSVPASADLGPGFELSTPARTISVRFGYGDRGRKVRYEFMAMPITGPGHR